MQPSERLPSRIRRIQGVDGTADGGSQGLDAWRHDELRDGARKGEAGRCNDAAAASPDVPGEQRDDPRMDAHSSASGIW